jgi:hypothetical protein
VAAARKAKVTLDGVPLAGTQTIAWKFVGGTAPYTTTFSVHKSAWEGKLKTRTGQPLTLEITDSRGIETKIEKVYILHEAPSDSPHRVTFVVADKRWLWSYKLVCRDYNLPRKTGDRTAFGNVPVETQTVVDKFDYLPYSLDAGKRWTARRAVENVLEILEPVGNGLNQSRFRIETWPIIDAAGTAAEFTLQGVTLRDSGDVALSRLLSYIPGAEVYVDATGTAIVFDASDLDATEDYFRNMPEATYAGEAAAWIDRKKIRPTHVVVHYQREVECLFRFSDDYSGGTVASMSRSAPYIENVLPTVDPETTLTEYDPESGTSSSKVVPPGTWVRVDKWLEAMNSSRPADSFPWTFDTIKRHWLKGDLEGVLGAKGKDLDATANIASRIGALREHFRQTFRINRRYMERVRNLMDARVALLDPVTGARAPAAVWGQACIIPSTKGKYMAARSANPDGYKVFRNVDYLAPSDAGAAIVDTAPGPMGVDIIDHELGIFRVSGIASPYGTVDAFIPCHLVEEGGNTPTSITRDMSKQDDEPMGAAMKVESGTNGIFLRDTMRCAAMLTIVPAAPNNELQFHRVVVQASDVQDVFRKEFRIQGGEGPPLEVFVPPGEATARFAWSDDAQAFSTVQDLLGLIGEENQGIESDVLPGFVLANEQRHLSNHAISVAAEMLSAYADNVQGQIATRVPDRGAKLVGNMSGAIVRVASAPSAKVDVLHQFPGQQRTISRLAVMPESARQIVLGIVPFR